MRAPVMPEAEIGTSAGGTLTGGVKSFPNRLYVADIRAEVARHFGLTEKEIVSHSRLRRIARPRHVAMYLARRMTERSLEDIARRLGASDHTTVLHACRRVEALMGEDPDFAEDVLAIASRLQGPTGEASA